MTPTAETIRRWRNTRPRTADELHNWLRAFTGVTYARCPVCIGHQAPFEVISDAFLDRSNHLSTLVLGSRGSGKSFGAATVVHLDCRFNRGHKARILGGSKAQSQQIYEALIAQVMDGRGTLGSDSDTIEQLLKTQAAYRHKSFVEILAASSTQVRGPHVPSICLDEVDEIDPDIRESAVGMKLGRKKSDPAGIDGVVRQYSTWHRPDGPMGQLIERAKAEAEDPKKPQAEKTKLYTFCVFEVLERCPVERSGPNLEHCESCPIMPWCHEDRFATGDKSRPPKAKLSEGHYPLADLIANTSLVSKRTLEADYFCKGPKTDGIWFTEFDPSRHVNESAEYNPLLPVHRAIDTGVRTGAVWFQVREDGDAHEVNVFADYFAEGLSAEANAKAIIKVGQERCGGLIHHGSTDPAGSHRNATGPIVINEYKRAGIGKMDHWPLMLVVDSLALLEWFVSDAAGNAHLKIHPRCKRLIAAMMAFKRGGKAPQWSDAPMISQHPHEDMVDALRGGLCHRFPQGRKPDFKGRKTSIGAAVN